MHSHAFGYAAFCVFLCDAACYALAELLQRGFGSHLADIVADEQHGEASVLHRWVESERCLACAAVDYSHEVGCAYDAVFTVGCCMLATNETFFDVHSVVISFFNCLILPCASYRRSISRCSDRAAFGLFSYLSCCIYLLLKRCRCLWCLPLSSPPCPVR